MARPSLQALLADTAFTDRFRDTFPSCTSWAAVVQAIPAFRAFGDPCRQAQRCASVLGLTWDHFGAGSEESEAAAATGGTLPAAPVPSGEEREDGYADGGNTWTLNARTRCEVRSLDDLVRAFEIDQDVWEVKEYKCKSWEGYIKNAANQIETVTLYAVSARLCRRVAEVAARSHVADLIEAAREHMPRYAAIPRPPAPAEGLMLEFMAPDLHMGKLAWAPECGENYDVHIATEVFEAALEDILAASAHLPISRVCFPVGNDLLNADNLENTTTGGTAQSTDGRQQRTYLKTRELIVRAIERLASVADVDVVIVPGNHDRQSMFQLGDSLQCWFRNCSQVRIDNGPALRKYYEFGRNLFCFTHGSEENPRDLPLTMAVEADQAWARCTASREVHLGHLHINRSDEFKGILVRRFPSLCAAEDWHKAKAYIGARREAYGLVWSEYRGKVGEYIYSVPRDKYTK